MAQARRSDGRVGRGDRVRTSLIALAVAASATLLAAGPPVEARPAACGGAVPVVKSGSATCWYAASGSPVEVQGGVATAGATLTYSLICPVCPTAAGVSVTVSKPGGQKVARCSLSFVLAAACVKSSERSIARGTLLKCSMNAYGFVGVATYLCNNRG